MAYRPRLFRRARRFVFAHATAAYLGAIALLTALLLGLGFAYAHQHSDSPWPLAWVALLLLLPASDVAIAVVQSLSVRFAPPRRLPRLDFLGGVPESARTMVVVPTLLTSVERVGELLEHLEVLALGNLDPRVHFAILSDFTDAPAREMPQDEAILDAARAGVEALNARHAEGRSDRFYLVHRVRQWNPARGRLHGLGAQARQDRGVEPPPAGSHGHELHGGGRRRRGLPRRPLLHHPRLRHAPAPGRREEADRHRRPPAEPAPLRPASRPRHRGLRDPPAPGERDHGERRRLALRAALRRAHRRRPLHDRGLRHVPGPLRRGDLHRQGALRRGCLRRRPRGARARERSPLARPLRGAVRAHGPRHRHRGGGRLPGERPRPRAPPAPLGARRLADPVVAVPGRPDPLRPPPQPPAAHLPLEDPGQPEAKPDGARDRGPAAARVDDPPGKPRALDGRGPGRARLQPLPAGAQDPRRPADRSSRGASSFVS